MRESDVHPQNGEQRLGVTVASETRARLDALLALTVDAVITIDDRGVVDTFNSSAQRIFGYAQVEVVGRPVNMLMPEPYASQHDSYIRAYLQSGRTRIIGIGRGAVGLRKDGASFPMALAVTESIVAGRRIFTGVIRDLTDSKQTEQALNDYRARLEILVAERTAALLEANRRLEVLAGTDALTGLANRRRLDETLHTEVVRANRSGLSLCLAMCEIEYFKRYNDRHGHPGGDRCLRAVSTILADSFRRAGDLCARYGGEEFAVVLPDMPLDCAIDSIQLVLKAVWNLALPHQSSPVADRVALSIGVASLDTLPGSSADQLLARANRALYEAKKSGRNRVAAAASDRV